jgi:fatty acyl-CoA reductase
MDSSNSIVDYYKNKSVFLTGSTGFLGKLLIEKLLSTCSEIKTIYCLIREKNGVSPEQRLNEIISCKVSRVSSSHVLATHLAVSQNMISFGYAKVFDSLRKKYPNFNKKLTAIGGQILDDRLGIDENCIDDLVENVNITFHLAGTVKYDEDLRYIKFMIFINLLEFLKLLSSVLWKNIATR